MPEPRLRYFEGSANGYGRHVVLGGFRVAQDAEPQPERETVKRPDLFGNVHDTHQTESELNGWRETQGRML